MFYTHMLFFYAYDLIFMKKINLVSFKAPFLTNITLT